MKEINLPSGRYIAVEVPEGTKSASQVHVFAGEDPICFHNEDGQIISAFNPSGSWSLIGLASELKEEDWKGIVEGVERFVSNGRFQTKIIGFKDYERFEGSSVFKNKSTATESALSLLASHNLNPSTTVIIKNLNV